MPVLQQIAAMFLSKDYPSDESELPRAMGTMDFDLRGTKGTRSAGTFDLWMAQVRTQPAFSLFGHEKRPLNLPRQARDNHKKETRWKETHTEREGAVFSFRAEILR